MRSEIVLFSFVSVLVMGTAGAQSANAATLTQALKSTLITKSIAVKTKTSNPIKTPTMLLPPKGHTTW